MDSVREITQKNLEKMKQLEHRRQLEQYAQKRREKAMHDALIFKVGKIVLECWPWVSRLTVCRTKNENENEFAAFKALLSEIASDPHYSINNRIIASGKEDI